LNAPPLGLSLQFIRAYDGKAPAGPKKPDIYDRALALAMVDDRDYLTFCDKIAEALAFLQWAN